MTMNNTNLPNPDEVKVNPTPNPVETAPKEKRVYSAAEKLLLLAALIIAILYDRLMVDPIFTDSDSNYPRFVGAFWLCFLVIFCWFYWKRIKKSRILWYIAGCSAALCMWSFFFWNGYSGGYYGILNHLVIPAVLMAFIQFAAYDYNLKDAVGIAFAWLLGWFVKPFSGIPAFAGSISSLLYGDNKSNAKKAALGVGITLPLLLIILPLLSGADRAFGYHLERLLYKFNLSSLAGHLIVIAVAFALFYSVMWNIGFGVNTKIKLKKYSQIDDIICCIVLGVVTLLYLLFCAVQFTYLFAEAGLPGGMTYSEYAREGFAQTVAVCAINLLIFGVFLQFGAKSKSVTGLMTGLLALTAVMLVSGFVRLGLYIDAYGMTWLRLLSAWFVIYLAAVIILCGIRMWRKKMPVIALCALILLGWYVVLGYSNPDALVNRYNQIYNYDVIDVYLP